MSFEETLGTLYQDTGPELVGFIMPDGAVIKVANICSEPEHGFEISVEDILKYCDDAIASWHTHPGSTNVLSVSDFISFRAWPEMDHYILGNNGVQKYIVTDGEVLIA